ATLSFLLITPPTLLLYTLSLHDALPIYRLDQHRLVGDGLGDRHVAPPLGLAVRRRDRDLAPPQLGDHRGIELQPGGQRSSQDVRSEEHTSELQSLAYLVCRLLLEKKKKK